MVVLTLKLTYLKQEEKNKRSNWESNISIEHTAHGFIGPTMSNLPRVSSSPSDGPGGYNSINDVPNHGVLLEFKAGSTAHILTSNHAFNVD